ncbi:MAG: HU family DNA-binding protein [Candidatus Hatepunaea meridiana]|nr:HU family DNA-binding protein [Candidatus Hatepunaea meridiana]
MKVKTYIKKDVVDKTAEKTGLDSKEAAKAVNAVFDGLRELMTEGPIESRIEIRNFGVFEVKRTAAKPKARNPKKPDQVIYIPPRRKTLFRPGKILKSILKQPLSELE